MKNKNIISKERAMRHFKLAPDHNSQEGTGLIWRTSNKRDGAETKKGDPVRTYELWQYGQIPTTEIRRILKEHRDREARRLSFSTNS